MPIDEYYFDGAGAGRLSPDATSLFTAYNRVQAAITREDLHTFHFLGSDIIGASHLELERDVLSAWRGVRDFEEHLARALGAEGASPGPAVLCYGSPTGALFRVLQDTFEGMSTLWLDQFYDPWRRSLAQEARSHATIPTRDVSTSESTFDELVERIASTICAKRPQVVFLPAVTQLGVRMPLEEVIQRVTEEWIVPQPFWRPLFVIDGCQAFCRTPLDLGSGSLRKAGCAYIGCMHKAMRGPKDMAFLCCTNAAWHSKLLAMCTGSRAMPELFQYAKQSGTGAVSSTVDCGRMVVAGVMIKNCQPPHITTGYHHLMVLERVLRSELPEQWTLLSPSDERLWSGIVALRPPHNLRHLRVGGVADMLASDEPKVRVDEVAGAVRIAIDKSHDEAGISTLIQRLRERAS